MASSALPAVLYSASVELERRRIISGRATVSDFPLSTLVSSSSAQPYRSFGSAKPPATRRSTAWVMSILPCRQAPSPNIGQCNGDACLANCARASVGERGVTGDLVVDGVAPAGQWRFSAGPRLTAQSTAAVSPYFSITPAQAAGSTVAGLPALPVYHASGGFYSYGAGTQAEYFFNTQWAAHVFVEYQR